ncbi:GDSL-type esterase/lipase family protein [Streptomyces sp. V4-01]|uniref:GDSL-type esterase/lipase family protein n=1 Tax=Actinacidiphila polyblastidii TaxID=3110430 RepID=A0ABU7PLK3_9ACTN|nr:GDSL-type esterase/lipase family protein [Streptomyces sp. V4-01]
MRRHVHAPRRRALLAAAALTLGTTLLALPSPAASAAAPDGWTGTWSVSPQSGGPSYGGQTLRQIVHTGIGGASARLRVSNVFGSSPLTVRDVHLARRTAGAAVDTATDRAVTFGGQTAVTVPAGQSAVSDAAAFTVAAQSDVAVSFYLPNATGPATYHQQGTQTNYVASGDVSAAGTLNNPSTTGSYAFLSNLDVQNAAAQGAVVAFGASITDGVASAQDSNRRWPNDLAARLAAGGRTVGVLNQGISGNRLLADGAGPSALNRFDRDVLGQPGVRWVIFSDDPLNDLGGANPPTGAQLIAGLQQLISRAHQAGVAFLCSTLTPFEGAGYWTPAGETGREALNAFVRGADSGCDGVVDQDTATHDPAHPTRYLPAYDSGDHLHPDEAGLQAIADAVNLNLFGAQPPTGSFVALRSHANGRYVTAENAGASALIADGDAAGAWQQFDEVNEGNGLIALRAHADGMFVTAENAGAAPLIANRAAAALWETFQLVQNPDHSVSLRAQVNGRYVTAENAGAAPLVANRDAVGPWEEFDLVQP